MLGVGLWLAGPLNVAVVLPRSRDAANLLTPRTQGCVRCSTEVAAIEPEVGQASGIKAVLKPLSQYRQLISKEVGLADPVSCRDANMSLHQISLFAQRKTDDGESRMSTLSGPRRPGSEHYNFAFIGIACAVAYMVAGGPAWHATVLFGLSTLLATWTYLHLHSKTRRRL